jgi:GMP synthase (glutamine-hydrolysing)
MSSELCNVGATFNRVIVYLAGRVKSLGDGSVRAATITRPRLDILREADWIARQVLEDEGLTESIWQFPVAMLPFFYQDGETIVLRPVNSSDGMTAKFGRLPLRVLQRTADTIARISGVGAVFLDVTDKPPATIEWE